MFSNLSLFLQFPNVSETAKIHVAVRVMGDTGAGAPMYFDMANNNHSLLEMDSESSRSEVYSGIAIGSLLSIACVLLFGLFIIFQQRRFKARAPGPTHLTTPTDITFGNLSSASGMPGDSAGGLSGGTLQQDCHEMQTLIPRSRYHIELLPEHTGLEYQTSSAAAAAVVHLANGNGSVQVARRADLEAVQADLSIAGVHNLSQLPLCGGGTSPERKTVQDARLQEAKAFYIPYRHTPPNAVALSSSSSSKQCPTSSSDLEVIVPPNSLPLVSTMAGLGGGGGGTGATASTRRSGSLSSSSASSTSNGSSKKQFHTNFVRHSNSNDGICLLAEEEAAATLTPTSEREYAAVCLTNGFKLPADVAKSGNYTTNNNNSSSSSSNGSNLSQKSGTATAPATATATATAKDRQPRGNGNPISFSHNASIVPANGPASVNHASAVKQSWPAATVVHRRAQVDPNG